MSNSVTPPVYPALPPRIDEKLTITREQLELMRDPTHSIQDLLARIVVGRPQQVLRSDPELARRINDQLSHPRHP